MIILGIDPGTALTGFAVISVEGNVFKPIEYGCIYTDSKIDLEKRLVKIFNEISLLIDKYKPTEMAVEELFFNKNVKTALSVGQARGAVLLAGALKDLKVDGYTPLQIKQGVVGYGRADKRQVQHMVKVILNLAEIPKPDDAADAVAVAICHAHFRQTNLRTKLV